MCHFEASREIFLWSQYPKCNCITTVNFHPKLSTLQTRVGFSSRALRLIDNLTASSAKTHRASHLSRPAESCLFTACQNRCHLIIESFIVTPLSYCNFLLGRFFGAFAITLSKITQPHLKPSLSRPIPILAEEMIAVISAVVNFALSEHKLPRTHNRSSVIF